jgi:hypothetical protein
MSTITGPIRLATITNPTIPGRPTVPASIPERVDVVNSLNGRRFYKLNALATPASDLIEFGVDRAVTALSSYSSPRDVTAEDAEILHVSQAGTLRLQGLRVGRRITIVNVSAGGVLVTNANASITLVTLPLGGTGDFVRETGNDASGQPAWRCVARGDILDPPSGFPAVTSLQGWLGHLDSTKANASAAILPLGVVRINGGTSAVALGSISAIGSDMTGFSAVGHTHTLAAITDAGTLAALDSINNANWSGTDLAIANGGTGQSSATAAFDALCTGWQSIASAATVDLSSSQIQVDITGTTTITSFTLTLGEFRILRFAAALTLTHNASDLVLPGAANIVTAAGDVAFISGIGTNRVRCLHYMRASLAPSSRAIYSGDAAPGAGLGVDGDLYFEF